MKQTLFVLLVGCLLACNNQNASKSEARPVATEVASNKLDKAMALPIIKQAFEKDVQQKLHIGFDTFRDQISNKKALVRLFAKYKQLEGEGFLTLKDYGDFFHGRFTPKGQVTYGINKFSTNKVTVARLEIVDIIGISQTDNDATVRYSYKYTPHELYHIRRYFNRPKNDNCPPGIKEGKVQLKRYDTGWLIE